MNVRVKNSRGENCLKERERTKKINDRVFILIPQKGARLSYFLISI